MVGGDAKLSHKKMKTLFLSNKSKSRRLTSTFFPTLSKSGKCKERKEIVKKFYWNFGVKDLHLSSLETRKLTWSLQYNMRHMTLDLILIHGEKDRQTEIPTAMLMTLQSNQSFKTHVTCFYRSFQYKIPPNQKKRRNDFQDA